MKEEYITVGGIDTRYLVSGGGAAVVLIHGLGEFLETWWYNITPLSQRFTVYAIDLPGHGMSSEWKQDYTLDFGVRFVVDFMETMGIQRAHLVGRSLGAPICLNLAVNFPQRVDRLVLVSLAGFSRDIPLSYRLAALPVLRDILLVPGVLINRATVRVGMRRQFYDPGAVPEEWVDAAVKYLKMPKRKDAIQAIIRSNLRAADELPEAALIDRLRRIESPTLLIHGRQDRVVAVEHAYSVSRLIPQAKLEVFEHCGHNPQIEKASRFNRVVLAFLSSNLAE